MAVPVSTELMWEASSEPRTKHESADEKAYLNDMSKLVEQLSNHVQITVIYEEISEGLLKC